MQRKPPVIGVGNKRKARRIIGGIIAATVLFVAYKGYREVFGYKGTAADVRQLERIYRNAGPSYAAFYTNTFLQQMPFSQPIAWRCPGMRPSVSLTSSVNVAVFKQTMAAEQFTYLWDQSTQGKPVATFTIHHRVGDRVVQTDGRLDLVSGGITMNSMDLERMLDDAEWRHLTNRSFIQFEFK